MPAQTTNYPRIRHSVGNRLNSFVVCPATSLAALTLRIASCYDDKRLAFGRWWLAGIAAFGGYVPRYRLGAETAGWNSSQERSIANFDEDSVTMAVAAGGDCLLGQDRQAIDGLIFATTTPPYAEKQCAAIIATALDLRRDIFAADVTDVLRAGTTALKSALDSVQAGSAQKVLVIASDNRQGAPRGDIERNLGDGAAALLVSRDGVIASLEGSYSITENMLDSWRSSGDPFVRSWEDRFATEEGLERILGEAVSGFLQKQGLQPQDVTKIALYAPDGRRHSQLIKGAGFTPEQAQDPLFGMMGNTGAAFPLMLLITALEAADPDQLMLTVSYGDGSDVLGFRTTEAISELGPRMGVSGYLKAKQQLNSYETYARWRDVWVTDAAARRPTAALTVSHCPLEGERQELAPLWCHLQPVWLPSVSSPAGLRQLPGSGRLYTGPFKRPSRQCLHILHGLPRGHDRLALGNCRRGL